jgi:hypothetical protein
MPLKENGQSAEVALPNLGHQCFVGYIHHSGAGFLRRPTLENTAVWAEGYTAEPGRQAQIALKIRGGALLVGNWAAVEFMAVWGYTSTLRCAELTVGGPEAAVGANKCKSEELHAKEQI